MGDPLRRPVRHQRVRRALVIGVAGLVWVGVLVLVPHLDVSRGQREVVIVLSCAAWLSVVIGVSARSSRDHRRRVG